MERKESKEQKEVTGDKINSCKKPKVQIRSAATFTKVSGESKEVENNQTTNSSDKKSIYLKIESKQLGLKRNSPKPETIVKQESTEEQETSKEETIVQDIKTKSDNLEFQGGDIAVKSVKLENNSNINQNVIDSIKREHPAKQENSTEIRPRVPVSLPLANFVNVMETDDLIEIYIDPGFYTEQTLN